MKSHSMQWFALIGMLLFLGVAVAPGVNGFIPKITSENIVDISVNYIENGCVIGRYSKNISENLAQEIETLLKKPKKAISNFNTEDFQCIYNELTKKLLDYDILPDNLPKSVVSGDKRINQNFYLPSPSVNNQDNKDSYSNTNCEFYGILDGRYSYSKGLIGAPFIPVLLGIALIILVSGLISTAPFILIGGIMLGLYSLLPPEIQNIPIISIIIELIDLI